MARGYPQRVSLCLSSHRHVMISELFMFPFLHLSVGKRVEEELQQDWP